MPEDHKEDLTVRNVTIAEKERWRMNCAICGKRIDPNDNPLIAPQGENKLPHFYHTDCYHKSDRK